jgi:hypothetical protein
VYDLYNIILRNDVLEFSENTAFIRPIPFIAERS